MSIGRGTSLVRHSKNAFHKAVSSGRVDVLQQLLKGVDPDDILGPLHTHKPSGSVVNVVDDATGYTPLQLAVVCGKHDVIRFLLKEGADVNRVRDDGSGDTALTLAAKKGARVLHPLSSILM